MFDFLCTPEKITGSFVKLAMWFGLIKVKINSRASLFTWIPLWNYSWNIGLAAYFFNNVDFSLHWETWLNKFSLKRSISTLIEMYLQGQWMIVSYIYIYICLNSFVPFLLDMCDFLWGEAFLHKREQFPHRLVLLSTAESHMWEITNRNFLLRT